MTFTIFQATASRASAASDKMTLWGNDMDLSGHIYCAVQAAGDDDLHNEALVSPAGASTVIIIIVSVYSADQS